MLSTVYKTPPHSDTTCTCLNSDMLLVDTVSPGSRTIQSSYSNLYSGITFSYIAATITRYRLINLICIPGSLAKGIWSVVWIHLPPTTLVVNSRWLGNEGILNCQASGLWVNWCLVWESTCKYSVSVCFVLFGKKLRSLGYMYMYLSTRSVYYVWVDWLSESGPIVHSRETLVWTQLFCISLNSRK